MSILRAFILGLIEFRCCVTTGFGTDAEYEAYDTGRDLAHKLTLRHFDSPYL